MGSFCRNRVVGARWNCLGGLGRFGRGKIPPRRQERQEENATGAGKPRSRRMTGLKVGNSGEEWGMSSVAREIVGGAGRVGVAVVPGVVRCLLPVLGRPSFMVVLP